MSKRRLIYVNRLDLCHTESINILEDCSLNWHTRSTSNISTFPSCLCRSLISPMKACYYLLFPHLPNKSLNEFWSPLGTEFCGILSQNRVFFFILNDAFCVHESSLFLSDSLISLVFNCCGEICSLYYVLLWQTWSEIFKVKHAGTVLAISACWAREDLTGIFHHPPHERLTPLIIMGEKPPPKTPRYNIASDMNGVSGWPYCCFFYIFA